MILNFLFERSFVNFRLTSVCVLSKVGTSFMLCSNILQYLSCTPSLLAYLVLQSHSLLGSPCLRYYEVLELHTVHPVYSFVCGQRGPCGLF